MGRGFTFSIAKQKGSCPCIHVRYATVVDLCCVISLYNNKMADFQGVQSCEIVFVACNCDIQCILHHSCPTKTQRFSTRMRNQVIQPITLYASCRQTVGLGPIVGHSALSIEPRNTYCVLLWAVT